MMGGSWTPFLSDKSVSLTVLTEDVGRQGLFVWDYPNPDSLLANLPWHHAFGTHCCIRLPRAESGHLTTK